MEKRCLIIDNDDQSAEIEKLKRDGKARGIEIECEQFNVGSTFEDDLLSHGKIDIDKVVSEFRKRFKHQVFHLAAFDWDLSDEDVNGVELMRLFEHHKILKNTPKLLYTGLLEERLSTMLDEFKAGNVQKSQLKKHILILIKADIKDFVARENYEQDILRLIERTDETIDLIIEEELSKFPDFKFNNSFTSDNFKGKTFMEISSILENDDRLRNDFKKEIIQHVIAYLTIKI
ncbi:MAG: hypothetical protein JSS79_15470 [Bacteroidetes bacterium]|nr:hypothetical protein [Bacteroidota bacterium]